MTTPETKEENRAKDQAKANYESICDLIAYLDTEAGADRWAAAQTTDHLKELLSDAGIDGIEDSELAERVAQGIEDGDITPEDDDYLTPEQAADRIQEDPLEVSVRSGWYQPGSEDNDPAEFYILLCTGGPACRIRGELDHHGAPDRAWLEFQDWGTPWTQYFDADQDQLLTYCRQFYFRRD